MMDDLTFEQQVLVRIAAQTAYPAARPMRASVLAAITDDRRQQDAGTHRRPLAFAVTAVVAAAMLVLLALPGPRGAVADFFGIRGSKIEILPTPVPGVTPTPLPTPAGIRWIATPTSLDGAQSASGFAPMLPPGHGTPDGVYLVDYGDRPVVVLEYEQFDLWESQTDGFFVKGVAPGIDVHDRTVKGQPATWIGEGEHIVAFEDANGQRVVASVRTAERGTLVWASGRTFYRLETDLPEEDAVQLAESLP
jgi:hypothetical protein